MSIKIKAGDFNPHIVEISGGTHQFKTVIDINGFTLGTQYLESPTPVGDLLQVNIGIGNTCSGLLAFAHGKQCVASSTYQHVEGKFNVADSNNIYQHIVGGGTDEAHRSNISTLDWSGNAWFAGTVTAEGNKQLATREYVDRSDYTAFEVYPTTEAYPIGASVPWCQDVTIPSNDNAKAIPASLTFKLILRSKNGLSSNDVIIDWGDGNTSKADHQNIESGYEQRKMFTRTGTLDEYDYLMSHTYASSGKYIVKIYGKDYFAIYHHLTDMGYTSEDSFLYNLTCSAFTENTKIAKHLTNLSSLYEYSLRILDIKAHPYQFDGRAMDTSAMFRCCYNLCSVIGFKGLFHTYYSVDYMFDYCENLEYTDFRLPSYTVSNDGLTGVFNCCLRLATDISKLIPKIGFIGNTFNVNKLFYNCRAITGTVPSSFLWENCNINWASTNTAFYMNPQSILNQVPVSWGGTNASIKIPNKVTSLNGGTVGQVLTKTTNGSEWGTPAAGGSTLVHGGTTYTGNVFVGDGLAITNVGSTNILSITAGQVSETSFTAADLVGGTLTLSNYSLGSVTVADNNGMLVLPAMQQSGNNVLVDLSGFTVSGTWKVYNAAGRGSNAATYIVAYGKIGPDDKPGYYRKWSNGTMEQWGIGYTYSSSVSNVITYPLAFLTVQMIMASKSLRSGATLTNQTQANGLAVSYSKTSCTVYSRDCKTDALNENIQVFWYAIGLWKDLEL